MFAAGTRGGVVALVGLAACVYQAKQIAGDSPCTSQTDCAAGAACHPFQGICVPSLSVGCGGTAGEICPDQVSDGDACPSAGSFVPCWRSGSDCAVGYRTCGNNLLWGGCESCDLGTPTACACCDNNCLAAPQVVDAACLGTSDPVCSITACQPGVRDTDKVATNGCEETCTNLSPEICDGSDNDCDGLRDNAPPNTQGCITFFRDHDGDAFGVNGNTQCLCAESGEFTATQPGDCDDSDNTTYPGAPELCDGNLNNCSGPFSLAEIDQDLDGYVACSPWNDSQQDNPEILDGGDCLPFDDTGHPGAPDMCDGGADNDCDPNTSDGSTDPGMNVPCDGSDADTCTDDFTDRCSNGTIVCDASVNGTPTCSNTAWQSLSAATTSPLRAISCTSVNTCVAVGLAGTILVTNDGGASWAMVPSIPTSINFRGVAVSTAMSFAVGNDSGGGGGVFYRATSLSSWSAQPILDANSTSTLIPAELAAVATKTNGPDTYVHIGGSQFLAGSVNSGASFTALDSGAAANRFFNAIHDNAKQWFGGANSLAGIPSIVGWCDFAPFCSSLGELSPTQMPSAPYETLALHVQESGGLAVVIGGPLAGNGSGCISKGEPNGSGTWSWRRCAWQGRNIVRGLSGLEFSGNLTLFAVGDTGTLLRSEDGGTVWAAQVSPFGDAAYYGVSVPPGQSNPDVVYAVGERNSSGVIIKTTSGGL